MHRTGGSCAWTATADSTAEIVGPAGGLDDGTFAFHVLPSSDHFRIGEVDVRWPDGSAALQYAQAACAFFLTSELDFDANGGTKWFGSEMWRECPFKLTASADWVTDVRQDITGNLSATAGANSLHATRSATITVRTLFGDIRSVTVSQAGN